MKKCNVSQSHKSSKQGPLTTNSLLIGRALRGSLAAALVYLGFASSALAFDQACREKLDTAGRIGLIQDMQITAAGAEFVVDEEVFRGMAFRSKQGLVDTINCGLLEKGKRFNPIIFRSDRSNKEIGRDEWGKLSVN